VSPTARAASLVGLLAVSALFIQAPVVAVAGLIIVAVAIADFLALRGEVKLTRTISPLLSRGVPEPLSVTAEPPPGTTATIRQAAPPELRVDPPLAEGELAASVVASRRGRHRLPGSAARVRGPLGLVAKYESSDEEAEVLVYPDLPAARRLAVAVREGSIRDPGLRPRGPLGLGTEFESIRDYVPDDDVRQVNWRASARLGRPMSNQYRLDRDRDVILAVDMGRLMGAGLGGRTRLDAALDAVTAVSMVAEEFGDRCGALAFDDRIRALVKPRRKGSRVVINALFDLEASSSDSDYEQAFRHLERSKRAFVLVLTDLVDEAAARPLVGAMPVLSRRHAVAVTSALDPDLDRAVSASPQVPVDAYRMLVAQDVLNARSRAATRLRAVGADVIEVPAGRLATACVRAYLTAKVRARL